MMRRSCIRGLPRFRANEVWWYHGPSTGSRGRITSTMEKLPTPKTRFPKSALGVGSWPYCLLFAVVCLVRFNPVKRSVGRRLSRGDHLVGNGQVVIATIFVCGQAFRGDVAVGHD